MFGVISFIKSIFLLALFLGGTGSLIEATGLVGREAAKAYQHGGISFVWLNNRLQGSARK